MLCWRRVGAGASAAGAACGFFLVGVEALLRAASAAEALPAMLLGAAAGALLGPPLRRLPGLRLLARHGAGLGLAAGLLLLVLAGSSRPPRPAARASGPELVLVTLDTTRADRYWAVAAADPQPGLEDGAARFERAWAPSGLTAPSHASLFTGQLPSRHGLTNNGGVLRGFPTLAGELRAAGWTTLAAPSVIHLDRGFGFGSGFDRFATCEGGWRGWLRPAQRFLLPRALLRLAGAGRPVRPGADTLVAAEQLWREAPANCPRFLWLHLFEPHGPYEPAGGPMDLAWPERPTPGFEDAPLDELRARYDGEIRDARRLLAASLERLRADAAARGREVVVVLAGDHGEALGEHGASDHGDLPYEEGTRVPLWVSGPGVVAGPRAAAFSLVEVGPGLQAWLGLDAPADGRVGGGRFAAALRGEAVADAPVRIETDHGDFRNLAWIEGGVKRVVHGLASPEVMERKPVPSSGVPADLPWLGGLERYELEDDPLELRETFATLPAAAREELAAFLRARLAELGGRAEGGPGIPPEIRRALAELGYADHE